MAGKLLKSALIAPVAALLLMMAAPVPAPAANEDRDGAFGYPGWWADQQDRWGERRDDRREAWRDRRDDRWDGWRDRRDRRQEWWQDRWRRHWDRWDRRAAQRRNHHPSGHRGHPHRY